LTRSMYLCSKICNGSRPPGNSTERSGNSGISSLSSFISLLQGIQQTFVNAAKTSITHQYNVVTLTGVIQQPLHNAINLIKRDRGNRTVCNYCFDIQTVVTTCHPHYLVSVTARSAKCRLMYAHFHGCGTWF